MQNNCKQNHNTISFPAYENVVLEVNTEKWIDLLKDETFPTLLCPFLLQEANMFISIYERLVCDICVLYAVLLDS